MPARKRSLHEEGYWESELESLGIQPKRKSELNDEAELKALAENMKQVYYQDYKTAYSDGIEKELVDASLFDYVI